jgi:Mg2+/Co2+ transporter CorC
MTIEDFNETFDERLADENYNTIGGYVMGRLECVPRVGDTVSGAQWFCTSSRWTRSASTV